MHVSDESSITCAECGRAVDELEAPLAGWCYWSDGVGELIPFCPGCSRPEVASALLDRVKRTRADARIR